LDPNIIICYHLLSFSINGVVFDREQKYLDYN